MIKMKHIFFGFISGLIIFFAPGLIDGNFGLIGSDYLLDYLPNGLVGLIILGTVYVFIGGAVFFILQNLFKNKHDPVKTDKINLVLKFSLGVALAYIVVIILILRAFSNFSF